MSWSGIISIRNLAVPSIHTSWKHVLHLKCLLQDTVCLQCQDILGGLSRPAILAFAFSTSSWLGHHREWALPLQKYDTKVVESNRQAAEGRPSSHIEGIHVLLLSIIKPLIHHGIILTSTSGVGMVTRTASRTDPPTVPTTNPTCNAYISNLKPLQKPRKLWKTFDFINTCSRLLLCNRVSKVFCTVSSSCTVLTIDHKKVATFINDLKDQNLNTDLQTQQII